MNLLINAEALRPPITGIGNYTYHLLEQFVQRELVDGVECFTGTAWQSGVEQLAASAAVRNTTLDAPGSPLSVAVATTREWIGRLPGAQRTYDAIMDGRFSRHAHSRHNALYHETNYILKPYNGPSITTVHDLSHVHYPQFHPEHVVDRLNHLLPESIARADIVIAVSELVRAEVLEHFSLDPAKVVTVYEGVDDGYAARAPEQTRETLDSYGLRHGAYVLTAATLEPRKGIDTLLDAWEQLPESLALECPLVLVGSTGWRNDGMKERIARMAEKGAVRHLGYVPASDLPILFAGARVFAYPSVYEGFGLPVLDAMRSRVPVVCRAGTSMAEFAQGACMLCETSAPEELAAQLRKLMEDAAEREYWADKGLQQSRAFSWERCADETLALYKALV